MAHRPRSDKFYGGYGKFGAAFMRLKLPPVGVVPPADATEPSSWESPERPSPGGRSPGSVQKLLSFPGSPS